MSERTNPPIIYKASRNRGGKDHQSNRKRWARDKNEWSTEDP